MVILAVESEVRLKVFHRRKREVRRQVSQQRKHEIRSQVFHWQERKVHKIHLAHNHSIFLRFDVMQNFG